MLYKKKKSFVIARLLARRLTSTLAVNQQVSRLARICFLSSTVVSCALVIALAVMNGFQRATKAAFQNIHADLILQSPNSKPLSVGKIGQILEKEFGQNVISYTPYTEGYAIVRSPYNRDDLSHVVLVQGINPEKDKETRALAQTMRPRSRPFSDFFKKRGIVIGQLLAENLGVDEGDTIKILFVPNAHAPEEDITLSQTTLEIQGICKTGIDELDDSLVVCNQKTFSQLFPYRGIGTIGIKLAGSESKKRQTSALLKKRFASLEVHPWYELYPALEAAFRLEQRALFLIAFFICLIASTNLLSLLSLFIAHKHQTIAALRAAGTPLSAIKIGFLIIGNVLVSVATAAGITIAALICYVLDTYHLIALPNAYYISHVPADLTPSIFILSFALNITCGLIATWWATRSITQLPLSTTLKEGTL